MLKFCSIVNYKKMSITDHWENAVQTTVWGLKVILAFVLILHSRLGVMTSGQTPDCVLSETFPQKPEPVILCLQQQDRLALVLILDVPSKPNLRRIILSRLWVWDFYAFSTY